MKRESITFLFIVIFLFVFFNSFIQAINVLENKSIPVTGNAIIEDPVTGKLTSQQVALSIFVQTTKPYIEISSPKNQTYLYNESIPLSYSVSDGDSVWYSLDGASNITLTYSPIYLNVGQGPHNLYLFSNKSENISSSKVTFTVNSSRFTILDSDYKGAFKGASTDFSNHTYEELQSLDNIILENTNYGKIKFNAPINMTNDYNNLDNILNIDSNVNLSSNHIELNSAELPNFNAPSTIWIYGLNFTNPRILKNGVVCTIPSCIRETYIYPSGEGGNGILKFNVTGFSVYSAEESPSGEGDGDYVPPSGGGGGGSGGTYIPSNQTLPEGTTGHVDNLTIIPSSIDIALSQGETKEVTLNIMNNYNGSIRITIEKYNLDNLLSISNKSFTLSYHESKAIHLNFSALKDTLPDTYVGKILIETDGGEIYSVLTSVNVQSSGSLFDIALKINEKKLPAYEGSMIWFTTSVYNLGENKNLQINIKYTIKDYNNKIIFEGETTENINTYIEKEGKIRLPGNIPPGEYILSARVEYNGKIAITSAKFQVDKRKVLTLINILIALTIIIFILILLIKVGKKERERAEREEEIRRDSLKNKSIEYDD